MSHVYNILNGFASQIMPSECLTKQKLLQFSIFFYWFVFFLLLLNWQQQQRQTMVRSNRFHLVSIWFSISMSTTPSSNPFLCVSIPFCSSSSYLQGKISFWSLKKPTFTCSIAWLHSIQARHWFNQCIMYFVYFYKCVWVNVSVCPPLATVFSLWNKQYTDNTRT